ncbi:hypothetical protein HBJ58_21715 [Halomonas desiderata]|jgi:pilus assembly protein Flp/PilA|uniref:Flp family type IVb pilin n=1 Tax=Billgrantia aerodenitrificans TaxID=2733483 RepID=A0ABS9ATY4_9GAMM|nr:hypothetical protein [Halomonas aerodenitrificans]MCE8025028.1 hypothetical protein [Halomonas aerodenitrificans]NIC39270.1 hypothetical protein [Halomonas desiderata]
MSKLMQGVVRFWREEEGTEVVEWAMLAALLVTVGTVIMVTIGGAASARLTALATMLTG